MREYRLTDEVSVSVEADDDGAFVEAVATFADGRQVCIPAREIMAECLRQARVVALESQMAGMTDKISQHQLESMVAAIRRDDEQLIRRAAGEADPSELWGAVETAIWAALRCSGVISMREGDGDKNEVPAGADSDGGAAGERHGTRGLAGSGSVRTVDVVHGGSVPIDTYGTPGQRTGAVGMRRYEQTGVVDAVMMPDAQGQPGYRVVDSFGRETWYTTAQFWQGHREVTRRPRTPATDHGFPRDAPWRRK